MRTVAGAAKGMEVNESMSREDCFYGGAFPLADETSASGDFLPKQCEKERKTSRCVSFDCDSLSERLRKERE